MSQPLLGLPEQTFDKLADHVDLICHAGALVDWMRPLDHYVGPNVASVHEVLRLAAQGRGKAIHYVSTVATLPRHAGYEVASDETEYGYATSKYMAETMIAAARWRGAQASVYRLPFVTASSSTGQYRRNRGDFLHNLITGSTDMGAFPFVDASLSGVLPVDYLTQTMAIVMIEDPDRINHDYDFMDSKAPDFNDFVAMICRAVCNEVEVLQIPFLQWREQALRYASQNAERPLARIAALVDGLRDEKDMASMLGGVDTYPGANVFGGEVFPAPEMNQAFVERYVACVKTNDGLW
jgi:polyketide synthase 12